MSDEITDIRGFLRKVKRGEPLNAEVTSLLLNRIYNILESLAGEGCSIEKPLDRKGLGWKVVVDGSHSDLEPAGRVPMPFEMIAVDNAWHVWLLDAEVVLNNYHATKAPNLLTDGGGRWTAATFAANSNIYLYVLEASETDTKHGADCYIWNVSTSVPTGALASVQLASVVSDTRAVQYVRGNQIFYTFADSEIITHDAVNAVVHVVTDSTSGTMPVDDHLAFVVRESGVLKYYKATDLLKAAYTASKDLMRNPPDEDEEPSDLMPIGDETYDEWEERIKEQIHDCLIADGWPYMPIFRGDHIWPDDDPNDFNYFGGWGVYDPVNDVFNSYWRGIDESQFDEWHLPGRGDLNEILRLMQAISDRLDAITNDPDGAGPEKSLLQQMCDAAAEAYDAAERLTALLTSINNAQGMIDYNLSQCYGLISDCQSRLSALDTRKANIDADVTALENLP